jgi:hypothetical protein
LSVSKVWLTTGPGPAIINCAPGCLVCAGGEFQVTFMPIACWPYGTFQPHQPFLRLMAPGQAIKAGMLAICGGFRSHLCLDDWLDRPCCSFSRHKDAKGFVVCDAAGWKNGLAIEINLGLVFCSSILTNIFKQSRCTLRTVLRWLWWQGFAFLFLFIRPRGLRI